MRSVEFKACAVLMLGLLIASAQTAYAGTPTVASPDRLLCSLAPTDDGGFTVSNLDARYGKLTVSDLGFSRPIVFELGLEGRHLRRVYPSSSHGEMTFGALPIAEYVIHPTDGFVDRVLNDVCGLSPEGLGKATKLKALASKAASDSDADRHSRRLAVEALQALLGLEFSARMQYPSAEGGDYRIYAGSDFRVTSTARNTGSEPLTGLTFELMAPDEWTVNTGSNSSVASLSPGTSASGTKTVRAPGRSTLRAPVFPMIASLTFDYSGRRFTIDYPFEVKLADPFAPTLNIIGAYPDRIEARISLKSTFPSREMKGISVYPWLTTALTIGPESRTVDMSRGMGKVRIAYLPTTETASYRAVTVIMKLDEHLVRLRSVMQASLDLGATTRGAALWLNDYGDGQVTAGTRGERRCRIAAQYMYFATSPNVPSAGTTYVTVTYFDGDQGSFALQYDSTDDAYKESGEIVKLEGTQAWKTKTFALDDIAFGNRQNAGSDFRLVPLSGDLAVAQLAVSKFLQAQTN